MEDSEYLLDDDIECECLLNDDNEASIQQRIRNCAENAIAAKHEKGCNFCRNSCATFAEVMGSLNTDSLVADKYELIKDSNVCNNEVLIVPRVLPRPVQRLMTSPHHKSQGLIN